MSTNKTGIWAGIDWWKFRGVVSNLLRRFGYRIVTRLGGLFGVDWVAGALLVVVMGRSQDQRKEGRQDICPFPV